jgi:DNA polymerase-3 subunit alpha (Gram-positive type)
MNYVTVDLETSGLDPKQHEILEIGILGYEPETLKPNGVEFSLRIKATKPCDPQALSINGLDPSVGVSIDVARAKLLAFSANGKMEATFHNARFDLSFLDETFGHPLVNKMFDYHYGDTMPIARALIAGRCSLQVLKKTLSLTKTEGHTALGDCLTTLELLKYESEYIKYLKNLEFLQFHPTSRPFVSVEQNYSCYLDYYVALNS